MERDVEVDRQRILRPDERPEEGEEENRGEHEMRPEQRRVARDERRGPPGRRSGVAKATPHGRAPAARPLSRNLSRYFPQVRMSGSWKYVNDFTFLLSTTVATSL